MKIAVSAGHNVYNNGVFDVGSVSPDRKLNEASITKKTVSLLKPLLKSMGHDVHDVTPYDKHFKSSKEAHLERSRRVKNINPDIYLDIHINAGGGTGPETLVYSVHSKAYSYARSITNSIAKNTGLTNRRGVRVKPRYWSVSLHPQPSIIVEGGFIDSPNGNDMRKLTPEIYARSIASCFGNIKENTPQKENKTMYRVRRSWDNARSQLGAYSNLDNAKKLADKNKDYYVFDEKGKVIYPVKHWADEHFDYLNSNGIVVKEKRFNDSLKRGEAMALLHRLHENLIGDVTVKPNPPEKEEKPIEEKPKPKPQPKSPFGEEVVEKEDSDYTYVYVPFDKILELRVAINGAGSKMLSAKEMQERYSFDYLINGGFFSYNKSINTIFDGRYFESSGDFSKFTMLVKRNIVEWGEFYRGNNTGAIGGSPSLIVNGKIHIDHTIGHENERHPRSAVGTTENGVIFLVVDGRTNGKGATLKELAEYMWNLGIANAINLDGGRSTILMKKDEVLNNHLEDRKIYNALGIWLKE